MWPNLQETEDLVTITKEILNGKLHFLCSVTNYIFTACLEETRLTTYKKLKNIQANEFSEVVSKFTKNVEINSFSGFISKFGHRFFSFSTAFPRTPKVAASETFFFLNNF